VYDVYLNLIYKYQIEKESHYSLYLIAKGDHLYQMNNNIKSKQQVIKHNPDELEQIMNIKVSSSYNIIKSDEEEYQIHLINNIEDITKILTETKKNQADNEIKIKFITNDTTNILIQLEKTGYSPKIYFTHDIYKLALEIDNIYISIEKVSQ
jgi:hypothetical protein